MVLTMYSYCSYLSLCSAALQVEKHQRTPTTLGVSLTTEHRKDVVSLKETSLLV